MDEQPAFDQNPTVIIHKVIFRSLPLTIQARRLLMRPTATGTASEPQRLFKSVRGFASISVLERPPDQQNRESPAQLKYIH